MKSNRVGLAVAFSVMLLGCKAEALRSNPAEQPTQTAAPGPAHQHDEIDHASPPSHEATDVGHAHEAIDTMLRLDGGQPWAADASLVEGMGRIRDAVDEASARPALDRDLAASLARSVRDQVNFLIANCRLEPDADATLHVFIARLLHAAAALEEDPASSAGLPQMQHTLHEYPKYFAHPD